MYVESPMRSIQVNLQTRFIKLQVELKMLEPNFKLLSLGDSRVIETSSFALFYLTARVGVGPFQPHFAFLLLSPHLAKKSLQVSTTVNTTYVLIEGLRIFTYQIFNKLGP